MASEQDTPGRDTPDAPSVPELSEDHKSAIAKRASTKDARAERKKRLRERSAKTKQFQPTAASDTEARAADATAGKEARDKAVAAKVLFAKKKHGTFRSIVDANIAGRKLPPCKKCGGPLLQCECRSRKLA